MSPLKIIVLLALFYLLYRLFSAGRRKKVNAGAASSERPPVGHDVLVEDPVCHAYVPKGQAIALRHGDKTHYFCSEKCCRVFLTHSDQEKGETG